ncbi:MAG: hypothetical protein H7838_12835, partial [Magnetococcus sp. DMHC-8]
VAARLTRIVPASAEEFKKAEPELRKRVEANLGQEQLTAFINALWLKGEVRIHQEILDRL